MPSLRLCGLRLAVLAPARSGAAAHLQPPVRRSQTTRLSSVTAKNTRDDRPPSPVTTHPGGAGTQSTETRAALPLLTLAIETSCDDACVAVMEKQGGAARLLFHERATADCRRFGGIQPAVAVASHTARLPGLVEKALGHLPPPPPPPPDPSAGVQPARTFRHAGDGLTRRVPDFVSVTRGPGIPTALAVGLNLAKGLAAAWQVPLVGVHHMQAHALTPRLVSALANSECPSSSAAAISPAFPFLTLLVSGGHTLLVRSGSLADHRVLAQAHNIAIGDCLDKAARAILPPAWLPAEWVEKQRLLPEEEEEESRSRHHHQQHPGIEGKSFGELLERFAFPDGPAGYNHPDGDCYYRPPASRAEELRTLRHRRPAPNGVGLGDTYAWALSPPGGEGKKMEFNFSGFLGSVIAVVQKRTQEGRDLLLARASDAPTAATPAAGPPSPEHVASHAESPLAASSTDPSHAAFCNAERRALAREVMRLLFENLGSRAIMALQEERRALAEATATTTTTTTTTTQTLVVSGGVASNGFLRHVLRAMLDARGFGHVGVVAPPARLCTDNAAMVAWAGVEMYERGWTTDGAVLALKEWGLDPDGPDGGVMGPPGWVRSGTEEEA
ncbi:hypothetical protein RB597_008595 [Gaeumannomyces tritici]